MMNRRTLHALFWLASFIGATQAFAPVRSIDCHSSSLHLQLDDSWDDVTQTLGSSKYNSVVEIYEQTAKNLQWKTLFSKDWFGVIVHGLQQAGHSFQALPLHQQAGLVGLPLLALCISTLYVYSFPNDDYRNGYEPYPRGAYDPVAAQVYYQKHPTLVVRRLLEIVRLSNTFVVNVLLDKYIFNRLEEMEGQRAQQFLELTTQLGPTAIKVGQALSVRPDLISPSYADALSSLQDQVPPFDTSAAKELLLSQLGPAKVSQLKVPTEPVASASIGQVYQCTTIDNQKVAVKIQRPNVLSEIALDLYIVKEYLAPLWKVVTKTATDLPGLANEWGRGFIAELDYQTEAAATTKFNEQMKLRELNAVCAPVVVPEYSSKQVLVTEWVDGTRLDDSLQSDVPRLCSVALNAYLVMLLELKSLHCDPHPGNLLRTTDGRLCILDFGMTLNIENDLQYSLLSFVAHLTSEDYDKLPEDLVALGFLRPEKLDFVRRSGILEPLKYFLKQANEGGGATGVRDRIFEEYRQKYPGLDDEALRVEMRSEMQQQMKTIAEKEGVATGITMEVEELQRRNRDSFKIPEWFLYSSRAFLTLEGVSLQADPEYSLIASCFPYVAKRLVGDDDPRARRALKDLIYGATDSVDVSRLTDLADGFSSYTTTTKTINNQNNLEVVLAEEKPLEQKLVEAEATITLAKDSADVFLDPDGNLVQNLLVEESALAASAQFKDSLRTALVDGPKQFRENLPLGVGSFLPALPFEDQVAPFVEKTENEKKAQKLADNIISVVNANSPQLRNEDSGPSALFESLSRLEPEEAALVLKELRESLPKYGPLVGKLGGKFASALLNTASDNIDSTLRELEHSGELPDSGFRSTVKGFSSAAQRGADAITPVSNSRETRARR